MTDEMLAERSRRGSSTAFAALVERHCDAVYQIAQNICTSASEAEEVIRRTFLCAYRDAASRPSYATFRAWLYGIAMREAMRQRRDAMRGRLARVEVFDPLDCMDEDARAAFVLCDLADLRAEDAEPILEASAQVVCQRLHRARLMLRGVLDRRWSA